MSWICLCACSFCEVKILSRIHVRILKLNTMRTRQEGQDPFSPAKNEVKLTQSLSTCNIGRSPQQALLPSQEGKMNDIIQSTSWQSIFSSPKKGNKEVENREDRRLSPASPTDVFSVYRELFGKSFDAPSMIPLVHQQVSLQRNLVALDDPLICSVCHHQCAIRVRCKNSTT